MEDEIWTDPRFMKLCIKLGDEARAIGVIIIAWRLAQKFWCPDKRPIPERDFVESGLPEALVEIGLADRLEDGIYVRGSEEHFFWWFKKQEAGRKGGEAKARNAVLAEASTTKQELAEASTAYQNVPSSSSSSSSSDLVNIKKISSSLGENKKNTPAARGGSLRDAPPEKSGTNRFIAEYKARFREKYGVYPPFGGKEAGIAKRLTHDQPLEKLLHWVQGYFQMRDKWFEVKAHDLATFEQNIGKIATAVETGRETPGKKTWEELLDEEETGP